MGSPFPVKLLNTVVIFFMLILVFAIPLFDAQLIFPPDLFPLFLINFSNWVTEEFENYLLDEKPNFYLGLAWSEILVNWPLSVVSLYGFAAGKSWFNPACLVLGFSFLTAQCAIFGELLGSGRASSKLLIFYSIFLALAMFTIIRGLLSFPSNSNANSGLKKKIK